MPQPLFLAGGDLRAASRSASRASPVLFHCWKGEASGLALRDSAMVSNPPSSAPLSVSSSPTISARRGLGVAACNRKRRARNQQGLSPLSGVVSVTNFICTKFRGFGPGQPKGYQLYLFLQISRRQFYWLRPDKSHQLYFYPTRILFRASNRTHWCWMDRGQCRINPIPVFWGGFARRGFRSGSYWTASCF